MTNGRPVHSRQPPGAAAFLGVRWRMLAPLRGDVVAVSCRSLPEATLEATLELPTAGSTVPGRAVRS
jgi:hypothetical protein